MEPGTSQNNQPNNQPPRKIVFNAPGTSFGMPKQNTQTSTPSASPKPFQNPLTQPLPGQPKISQEPIRPAASANPAFRSFAHDIKSNVTDKGVSMAQIVMDEERRKQAAGATAEDIEEATQKSGVLKAVLIIVGLIAIIGGGIVLFITFKNAAPVSEIRTPESYSPIRAQKVATLELRDGFKNTLLQAVQGVGATRIPNDTFVELKLLETVGTSSDPVGFKRLMEILDTRIPDALLRASNNNYVIGMYGNGEANVPFLMFSVDSFENAYVGMTGWERTMIGDIGGLFIDSDTLSVILASSTPSLFQDKVYYNKDTRTVFGSDGKPILVWAIIDRTNIVITRDGGTLDALIKRMTLENIMR